MFLKSLNTVHKFINIEINVQNVYQIPILINFVADVLLAKTFFYLHVQVIDKTSLSYKVYGHTVP